jgi:putative membrane protein
MHAAALVVAALVGLLHVYILITESFRWGSASVNRTFGVTPEEAVVLKPMAANMGLYNGFLAAGLFWGLLAGDAMQQPILSFFLACVAIAGVVGTLTTGNRRIVVIQTVPAAVGLVLLWAPI